MARGALRGGRLYSLFGLASPLLLDLVAAGFLAYAAALAYAAGRQPVPPRTLLAFSIADAAWVAATALLLLLFWEQFTLVARLLVVVVALVVEVFAILQFRAARVAPSAGVMR